MSTLTGAYLQFGTEFYFTPNTTAIFISGTLGSQTNKSGCGTYWQMDYGTGTAPIRGHTQTGTLTGPPITFFFTFAGLGTTNTATDLLTGLTPGTKYWIDFAVTSVPGNGCSGGNAQYYAVSLNVFQV